MVKHICSTCNKTFNKKSTFENHIKKKNHILKNENIDLKQDLSLKKNYFLCESCNVSFTRKSNLTRHINNRCKNKKEIASSVINEQLNILNEKYAKLIEVVEENNKLIKNNNLLKQTNINEQNINTTVNNIIINNIVQFGKEDISKCNLAEMINIYLKSTGGNIFSNILKYLNCNPNFPENFNIFMSDLSRENVKIYDGTKFVTKKFKNVKERILNTLSNHITNMCDTYIENPKIKKNKDILDKMKLNNISVKLINNDDITPLLTIKKENSENVKNSNEIYEYLDLDGEQKLVYYENKRHDLQEITTQHLKDELYNNKNLYF
jgi:hypothetical protein